MDAHAARRHDLLAGACTVKKSHSFESVHAVARALKPSYPVYCIRPEVLEDSARRFVTLFPGRVLYAIKCNPHPLVLGALYRGGIRDFDTASLREIALVADTASDARSYFMHPVKARAVIRSALTVYGVNVFSVDHLGELKKIYDETGGAGVVAVVRLKTPPADGTLYHLAAKFGCELPEAIELLTETRRLGMRGGICFHVGSQCMTPKAYTEAMEMVGEAIEGAGFDPICVDVGGGFPADYVSHKTPPLEDFMGAIRAGAKAVALKPTVELWAEPGRALVASGCSLLAQVQLRKDKQAYINDGIYGSLSEMSQVQIKPPARLLRLDGPVAEAKERFTINGPTCDSLDVLPGAFELPADLREGDWIEFDQMGAYSNALATHFNGFHPETFVTVHDTPPSRLG